jgi:hypothetical protein
MPAAYAHDDRLHIAAVQAGLTAGRRGVAVSRAGRPESALTQVPNCAI